MPNSAPVFFSAYAGLSSSEQFLHGLHFILCAFAVLAAIYPLTSLKGSEQHKFGGLIYLPLSFAALALGSFMAWREASFLLFCFNSFCAYLLLSGWRAAHESEKPNFIDWAIPGGLVALSSLVTLYAFINDNGLTSLYLLGFALNGFYLAWRDLRHLQRRVTWNRYKPFLIAAPFGAPAWLGRHIAGMVGSVMANASVVVLTLLPLAWHWLWPATLVLLGAAIAWQERQKKQRIQRILAPILKPNFARGKAPHDPAHEDDIRRAA